VLKYTIRGAINAEIKDFREVVKQTIEAADEAGKAA